MNTDGKILHQELTQEIIGAAFEVHNALGCGLLEKVYENALAHELALRRRTATDVGHRAAPSCLGLRAASSCRLAGEAGATLPHSKALRTAQVREACRLNPFRICPICVHPCPSVVD